MKFNKNTNFGNQKGLSVEVRNDNFNDAMRKFKRKIQDDGRLQEVKQRQEYIKPSERKAREKAAARARWLAKLKKENQLNITRN